MEATDCGRKNSKVYLRDQIIKWREERQNRLVARVLHNRNAKVSSLVFGTVPTSERKVDSAAEVRTEQSLASVNKTNTCKKTKTRPKVIPEIKHTIASKLRMIRSNPLLEAQGLITIPSKTRKSENLNKLSEQDKNSELNTLPQFSAKRTYLHTSSVSSSCQKKRVISEIENKITGRMVSVKQNSSVRRSLSADSKFSGESSGKRCSNSMRRVQSCTNVGDLTNTVITEEDEELDVIPMPITPKNVQTYRRSKSEVFSTSVERRKFTPLNVFTPTPDVMRNRLSDWLRKRGKSMGNFHHLHCFGLHASNTANNTGTSKQLRKKDQFSSVKRKLVHSQSSTSDSVTDTTYSEPAEDDNKENIGVGNSDVLVQEAVADLLKIIEIGYPWNQCEEWLIMIRKASPSIKEIPIYWECLAALEEARGDFKSAVDCYERAIVRGASPTHVGKSLDQLMEKFSILNLNCDSGNVAKNINTPTQGNLISETYSSHQ